MSSSLWNIEDRNPRPVNAQSASTIYVHNTDRRLPDLLPGFRIQDADRFTYPQPSFLYIDDGIRGGFTAGSSSEQQDIWIDKHIQTVGFAGHLDLPTLRNIRVTDDGIPTQQVVRDPGAWAGPDVNDRAPTIDALPPSASADRDAAGRGRGVGRFDEDKDPLDYKSPRDGEGGRRRRGGEIPGPGPGGGLDFIMDMTEEKFKNLLETEKNAMLDKMMKFYNEGRDIDFRYAETQRELLYKEMKSITETLAVQSKKLDLMDEKRRTTPDSVDEKGEPIYTTPTLSADEFKRVYEDMQSQLTRLNTVMDTFARDRGRDFDGIIDTMRTGAQNVSDRLENVVRYHARYTRLLVDRNDLNNRRRDETLSNAIHEHIDDEHNATLGSLNMMERNSEDRHNEMSDIIIEGQDEANASFLGFQEAYNGLVNLVNTFRVEQQALPERIIANLNVIGNRVENKQDQEELAHVIQVVENGEFKDGLNDIRYLKDLFSAGGAGANAFLHIIDSIHTLTTVGVDTRALYTQLNNLLAQEINQRAVQGGAIFDQIQQLRNGIQNIHNVHGVDNHQINFRLEYLLERINAIQVIVQGLANVVDPGHQPEGDPPDYHFPEFGGVGAVEPPLNGVILDNLNNPLMGNPVQYINQPAVNELLQPIAAVVNDVVQLIRGDDFNHYLDERKDAENSAILRDRITNIRTSITELMSLGNELRREVLQFGDDEKIDAELQRYRATAEVSFAVHVDLFNQFYNNVRSRFRESDYFNLQNEAAYYSIPGMNLLESYEQLAITGIELLRLQTLRTTNDAGVNVDILVQTPLKDQERYAAQLLYFMDGFTLHVRNIFVLQNYRTVAADAQRPELESMVRHFNRIQENVVSRLHHVSPDLNMSLIPGISQIPIPGYVDIVERLRYGDPDILLRLPELGLLGRPDVNASAFTGGDRVTIIGAQQIAMPYDHMNFNDPVELNFTVNELNVSRYRNGINIPEELENYANVSRVLNNTYMERLLEFKAANDEARRAADEDAEMKENQ